MASLVDREQSTLLLRLHMLPCRLSGLHCGVLVRRFHTLESAEVTLLSFFSPYSCKVLSASWTCGTWEAVVDWVPTRVWLHFPRLSANNLLEYSLPFLI